MGASISKWVAFLFFFLSFSLQLGGGAASLAAPQINQDFEESLAARTLKQEQEVGHEIHCSRERSRAARKIIEEYLLPVVEKERYNIPSRCRLRHDNDLYRDQEQHKIHVDINEWQCGYCKKIFYAENYLDQHFDNRHYDLLDVSHDKCLAEVCGALHCDLMMGSKSQKTKCNPAAAARNRHFCESLADNCFPVNEGPSASRLHEFFLHQFCNAHTCTGDQKPFSRGQRKRTSIIYLSITILTLMLVPMFYVFIYLYQRGLRRSTQDLKRISQAGRKKKSY
ncbi:uncharacterized protein LOC131168112 isoform X1 [Malania oleifera]|uniref:uncharacterized protein LOC131168112 isoform X1 n=1 Tax=Malania oleifera TaxID=397392 RepID=UPI0025AE382E|nr:uncharacterized protein LOC131168112 isoform X1 [Malania oleifera]